MAALVVFGVSFGVLATAGGIPGWQAVLMSAIVFAGSAQFAAVAVIASGGTALAAIVSGGLLNTRYIAIGVVAGRVLPGGPVRRALEGQLVIDESFALGVAASGAPDKPDPEATLVSGALLWVSWVSGTALGALLGPVVGDPSRYGLDAAFPALFVALLWPLLASRRAVRCAVGGALVALMLAPWTPHGVPLAGAALAGLVLA
jgi:4-azaleucine resistance transporter AzlC